MGATPCAACPTSVYYSYDGDCVEECPSGYEDGDGAGPLRACVAKTIPEVNIYSPGT